MGVTTSKLKLWDSKCAYQLCYLCVHDKSANAGTTLFGFLMWIKVKNPTLIKVRHNRHGISMNTCDILIRVWSVIQCTKTDVCA